MKYLFLLLLSLSAFATVPVVHTSYETTPIPEGTESSDDAAVWVHPTDVKKSLILGVSKNKVKDGGNPGLGVYALNGQETQYISHDRLNNVDLVYNFNNTDIAAASNRDKIAVSLFGVKDSKVEHISDLKMIEEDGSYVSEEPYGFCLARPNSSGKVYAISPMKSGMIYQHEIYFDRGYKLRFVNKIDTSKYLSKEQSEDLVQFIIKDVLWEYQLPPKELIYEVNDNLADRFQLEGCVSDNELENLYIGMENFGVWKASFKDLTKAKLIAQVTKSKSEPSATIFEVGTPRMVNDTEGLALHYGPDGKGALLVSVQGIDEYAFIDRVTDEYIGSFKLHHEDHDPITQTDGLELITTPLGDDYPQGIIVVHDHHNTDADGNVLKANYKTVSLRDVLIHFPEVNFGPYRYNPRE